MIRYAAHCALALLACAALLAAGCASEDWSREAEDAREFLRQYRNAVASAEQAQRDGDDATRDERFLVANEAVQSAARTLEGMPLHRVRDVEVITLYAEAQALAGQPDLIEEAFARLEELEPDNPEHRFRRALILAEMGPTRATQALAALREALRIEGLSVPRLARLHAALGRVAHEALLLDLAAEAYHEALALNPDEPWPRLGAALLLLREGDVAEAAAAIDAYGPIPGELSPVFNRLLRSALTAFDTSGQFLPDDPVHHMAYARLLIRENRFSDALLVLRRATAQASNDFVAWNMLGSVAARLGENTIAREAFNASLALNPEQPRTIESLENLGPG